MMSAALDTFDRLWGGLSGAVIGDAFGTVAETRSRADVVQNLGWIAEFRAPEGSSFAAGRPAGAYTDDSSQMLLLMESLISRGAAFDTTDAARVLLRWSADDELAARFSGPSTRAAITRLAAGEAPELVGRGSAHNATGTTNGAAMKSAPAGWAHPGDIEAACELAWVIAAPSHNTSQGVAGAAAIAAAVSAAADGASIDDTIEAAVRGAAIGAHLGRTRGRDAAGPDIARRIRWACDLARRAESVEAGVDDIAGLVGTGMSAAESVPAALAFVALGEGDLTATIIAATNAGDDSDTVTCMAGAISGTMLGRAGVPDAWYELVCDVNSVDLADIARRFDTAERSRSEMPHPSKNSRKGDYLAHEEQY